MSRTSRARRGPLHRTAALTAALCLAAPAAAGAKDYAATARNVIPSGQPGSAPPPAGADAQARLYDSLTPLFDHVTPADLRTSFKSEALGVGEDGPARKEAVPRRGVTILRDRYDVPHITGRTRDDVTWAMGWTLAEDRALLLAQGRYPARLAALDAPNVDAFSLVTGLKAVTPSRQAARIIVRNGMRAIRGAGKDGRGLLHDVDVYAKGINARLRRDGSGQQPWTRTDVFAINALVGQIFGEGGGDEPRRATFLSELRRRFGARAGDVLFDQLSESEDPDSPATLTRTFPYEAVPHTRRGNTLLDAGSLEPVSAIQGTAAAAAAVPPQRRWASNFLMVGAKRSATGHPLFVAGPQIGYFYPGLTLEADVKGPGFQARGATAPGFPGNILIGRGPDFAWSLTSAGSDLVDTFAERLCGGSRTRYRYKGRCRTMGTVDAGTVDGRPVRWHTTVHGPVTGYATAGGRPVALARKRASFGQDVLFQLPFRDMTLGRVKSVATFYKALGRSPFTFNTAYADDRHIAMYSAGKLPLRDPRVDPRLPTTGTGAFEWRGFLAPARHPHQADPASGLLVNWNNRPAPGWGAADDNWSYGSSHRVVLLRAGLARHRRHTLATVVSAMNAAATQDLRSVVLTPTLGRILAAAPAPSARDRRMVDLLKAWRAAGSSRLDRDLDGAMDAGAAPAIMDALYPKLRDAALGPVLGPTLPDLEALVGTTTSPATGFTGGGFWYLDKDLRRLAGDRFRAPYRTRLCGRGDKAACARALWGAVDAAGNQLASAQGQDDPAAWRSDANAERIHFAPGLLRTTIRYTNRPSGIQQVISFRGHRPR